MSEKSSGTTTISLGGVWFVGFICAKLAGIPSIAAWSWWWLFLPMIPILTELLKAVLL